MTTTKKEPETTTVKEPETNLAEVQAQIAQMLADAEAKAKEIVANAAAQVNPKAADDEARAKKIAEDKARGEELVEIKLFKDTGKYKDDVFVGCNGETIAIKRGERVKIKRKFAEILDNSERQDYETAELITRMQDKGE